jgi:hypothetical protein
MTDRPPTLRPDIAFARRVSARLKPSRKWEPLRFISNDYITGVMKAIWGNTLYTVSREHHPDGWPFGGGEFVRLGIHSPDGEPRHDWRDFQRIKNQLCGEEWEAVELFPAESRLVDPSNFYILWCAPRIELGLYEGRRLMDAENCVAPQRGWSKGDEAKGLLTFEQLTKSIQLPEDPE